MSETDELKSRGEAKKLSLQDLRYLLGLVFVLVLVVMGCSETSSRKVPCEGDAECVQNCTTVCDRRGEELVSSRCDRIGACACSCSPSGTGGAGGGGSVTPP